MSCLVVAFGGCGEEESEGCDGECCSISCSFERDFREPAKEKKNCATQKTVPASAQGECCMQAMLEKAISMSAPHTPIHGPVLSTPAIYLSG